jgi:hypothetical protein
MTSVSMHKRDKPIDVSVNWYRKDPSKFYLTFEVNNDDFTIHDLTEQDLRDLIGNLQAQVAENTPAEVFNPRL